MMGMVVALGYLKLKDKQYVKEFVASHLTKLNILACICFTGMVVISFANEQIVLHSVIYMPLGAIMLIIIALTGEGVCLRRFCKNLGRSVSLFFLYIKYALRVCVLY